MMNKTQVLATFLVLASCEVSPVEELDRTLSGTVLMDGHPLRDASLEIVSDPAGAIYEAVTDADGSFLLGVQHDEVRFSLQAYGDDWRSGVITVSPRLQNDMLDVGLVDFVSDAPGLDMPESLSDSQESQEGVIIAACIVPVWVSKMNSSGSNDSFRHCYSSCVATRHCGVVWASILSGVKEVIDDVCNAGGWLADLVDSSCTGWSWEDIQADAKGMQYAVKIWKGCGAQCNDEYPNPCGNGVCDNGENLSSCFDDCCVPINPCSPGVCGMITGNCGGLYNCGACGGCVNDGDCSSNDECGLTGGGCNFGVCECY